MRSVLHKVSGFFGRYTALGCLIPLFFSCATSPEMYKSIDSAVREDNFAKGIEAIKLGQERRFPIYPERNAVAFYLDKGLLEHYAGAYDDSSADLEEAERLIQEAYTKSVTANVASYIANDNTKDYPGEDYEDIYINVFNALNYYNSGDYEGAMVEIRKITMPSGKLDMLSRKYEDSTPPVEDWAKTQLGNDGIRADLDLPQGKPVNFSDSALARYLSFLFYLGEGKTDDARIELERFHEAFAANRNIYRNPVPGSVGEALSVPEGKARLNVIGFAGLSPIKTEEYVFGLFPFLGSVELRQPVFKLPKFVKRTSAINRIEVAVNGTNRFQLELLEDMGAVMEETFGARYSMIFLKTYVRVLLKYVAADIAARSAAEAAKEGSIWTTGLSALLAKVTLDASESADTRMSRYLPDKAYIGGVNLDPGTYTVTVNYYSGGKIIAADERTNVQVRAGALNLLETISLK